MRTMAYHVHAAFVFTFTEFINEDQGFRCASTKDGAHLSQIQLKATLRHRASFNGTELGKDLIENGYLSSVAGKEATDMC